MCIYQKKEWPNFHWDNQKIITLLSEVRNNQGRLIGKMEALGFNLRGEANLEMITLEIIKSNEIEGENLSAQQVRSSVARRLGMDIGALTPAGRQVEGVVDMVMEAIKNYEKPLSIERFFDWHFALFPTGRSGMYKIKVGGWREGQSGPIQVVSGALGKEKVHFQAPPAAAIDCEMQAFVQWLNNEYEIDPVLKSAIAHLWFLTIHPVDDGNGRVARTLTDMLLARSDRVAQRFYSMSSQIHAKRKSYYEILERTQKSVLTLLRGSVGF